LCKSLVDSVEEMLIQIQYLVADYYSCRESDRVIALGALDASFSELRKCASSTQLAINLLRTPPEARLVDNFSASQKLI
jgi:hypothetical protein